MTVEIIIDGTKWKWDELGGIWVTLPPQANATPKVMKKLIDHYAPHSLKESSHG